MTSPLPNRTPRPDRPRTLAMALGSLGLASTLALSGLVGGGAEMTEASWTDTEKITAEMRVAWATGGWARSSTNAYTNYASYHERTDGMVNPRPILALTERQDHVTSSVEAQAHTGTLGDINLDGAFTNFEVRTLGNRPVTGVTFCVQSARPGGSTDRQDGCTNSGPGSPTYSMPHAQARAKGWGRSGGYTNPSAAAGQPIVFMEANNIQTMAECAPDGQSRAMAPTASLPAWGEGATVGITSSFSKFSGSQPDSEYLTLKPQVNKRITQWILPRYRSSLYNWEDGSVWIRATLTSRAYHTFGYALSDIYMTVDQYRNNSSKDYLGSFTMVFSRSECGVKIGSSDHQWLAVEFENPDPVTYPANPEKEDPVITDAPVPNINGVVPSTAGRHSVRGLQESEALTNTLPSATPSSSPSEHTTASETTTSAPPNPDDTTSTASSGPIPQPTTPTATATPVIPDEPGTLSPTARLDDVETITVGEEDLVVVIEGKTAPTDARQGAVALEIWLNGGDPGTTWATFASDDPDEDGWRWAAINQKTGTVVYLR